MTGQFNKESFLTFIRHRLYFQTMKICHQCKKEITADLFIGRQTSCPSCGMDMHVCLNCSFYERGAYNDCRESQAERVLEKNRSNFCDYFHFQNGSGKSGAPLADAKAKLETLFKK
jgi:hypothetical protein